jgi:hypothetical protein
VQGSVAPLRYAPLKSAPVSFAPRRHIAAGTVGDIGFERGSDGVFQVVMDDMDRRRLGPGWLPRLTQAYGHAAALKYAEDHGYEVVTDEVEHDGTRRLTLRRSA